MEFKQIEEWKQNELQKTLEYFKNFIKEYNKLIEENRKIVEKHNYKRYFVMKELNLLDKELNEITNEEKEKVDNMIKEIDNEYDIHYEKFNKFKKDNSYFYTLQQKVKYLFNKSSGNEDKSLNEVTEIFKKDIDKHFEKLQNKVENKIGKIQLIYHLGGDDYRFEGEKGSCSIEVILAGGYNIQRLHTRWIVKK